MTHVEILRDPLRLQAMGSTRAGLIVAAMKGLFEAAGVTYPTEGEESQRAFEINAENAPQLILEVLRQAAAQAAEHGEAYADISFSLITDKKAAGSFVGRPVADKPSIPVVTSIEGEVAKDDDGVWRATVALG